MLKFLKQYVFIYKNNKSFIITSRQFKDNYDDIQKYNKRIKYVQCMQLVEQLKIINMSQMQLSSQLHQFRSQFNTAICDHMSPVLESIVQHNESIQDDIKYFQSRISSDGIKKHRYHPY